MPRPIRLLSGAFEAQATDQDTEAQIDRKAMLVYCGKFESMDGPVEIGDEHIEALAKNHNDVLTKLASLAGKDIPLKHCPPIQLDHSVSARDTVGRLVGPLEVGEYEGKKALYGNLRVLGRENVEKVKDGRWTHLSIGADLDSGKLTELTITPFPAAPDAAMLSRLAARVIYSETYQGEKFQVVLKDGKFFYRVEGLLNGQLQSIPDMDEDEAVWYAKKAARDMIDDVAGLSSGNKSSSRLRVTYQGVHKGVPFQVISEGGGFSCKVNGEAGGRVYRTELEAANAAKAMIDEAKKYGTLSKGEHMYEKLKAFLMGKKKLSAEQADAEMAKMADEEKAKMAGEAEKEELAAKCKKHLMDKEKLSEADAEKKLAEMDDESKKKMAGEYDAECSRMAEEAKKDDQAKMTARREKAVKLAGEIKTKQEKVKLAQRRASITARLSKYRALAKISPAEIKQYSIDELSKKSDEAIETLFESLEKRQPVIHLGAMGSSREVDVSKVAAEQKKKELESHLLGAMPFTAKMRAAKRLQEGEQEGAQDTVNVHIDTDPHTDLESDIQEIEKMMDQDVGKAKELLREKMKRYGRMPQGMAGNEYAEPAEKELKELATEVEKMHTDLEQLTTLVGEIANEKS